MGGTPLLWRIFAPSRTPALVNFIRLQRPPREQELMSMAFAGCTRLLRVCAVTAVILFGLATFAQEHRYTFEFGGGFTPPVGRIANRLNDGWNIGVGAGINLGKVFSIGPHFLYNSFGINNALLGAVGAPNGNGRVYGITADPKIQLGTRFSPYIVGGIGWYRRTIEFTQPSLFPTTFYDPYFGIFYPGVASGNQVLGSVTHGGIGGSLGAGLQFGIGHGGAKIFTEARYHYANTGRVPTRMIPVTFGIRF
jgi:hypothetical protein